MDDTLLLACGKTLLETNTKVKNMMIRPGHGLEWAVTHQSEFSINKFGIMGFTRRRESNPSGMPKTRPIQRHPIFLQATKILAVAAHKFLGIMLNQEL